MARALNGEHRHRGSHSLFVRFLDGAVVDGAIGDPQGFAERLARPSTIEIRHLLQLAAYDLDRHLARHFTRRMPPHPVGDDEQAALLGRVREERVFVSRSNHAHVAAGGNGQLH